MTDIWLPPPLQSPAAGSFAIQWDGLIQGMVQPDPEKLFLLRSGWLDPSVTVPLWGGMPIIEHTANTPTTSPPTSPPVPNVSQQGMIGLATNFTSGDSGCATGFSVFDQAYGMVGSPQSSVPEIANIMQVMFYAMGSGVRIALKMDPSLAQGLYGDPITEPVSWDFVNQQIIAFDTEAFPVRILRVYPSNCMVVNYNAGTGLTSWSRNWSAALVII